jgi:hypothetical protein
MLFGVPAVALTNGDFNGEDVLGRSIAELYARLGEVSASHHRVRTADSFPTAIRLATDSAGAIVRTALQSISPLEKRRRPRATFCICVATGTHWRTTSVCYVNKQVGNQKSCCKSFRQRSGRCQPSRSFTHLTAPIAVLPTVLPGSSALGTYLKLRWSSSRLI